MSSVSFDDVDRNRLKNALGATGDKVFNLLSALAVTAGDVAVPAAAEEAVTSFEDLQATEDDALLASAGTALSESDLDEGDSD